MNDQAHSSVIMAVIGALLVLSGILWLLLVADPLPMWIVFCGGGLVFLGTSAAMRSRERHQ